MKLRPAVLAFLSAAALAAASPASADPTYLALGDSYTVGEAVGQDKAWPWQMVKLLRRENIPIADPIIVAKTGWSASELSQAIDREKSLGIYDLVTLMIGVNDEFRGGTPEVFRKDFDAALTKAINHTVDASHVIVVSIPDWGATPYGLARKPHSTAEMISKFNAVAADESRRMGARWVNITTVSRYAARNPKLTASDGLHPSPQMHGLWARLIYTTARPILGTRLR